MMCRARELSHVASMEYSRSFVIESLQILLGSVSKYRVIMLTQNNLNSLRKRYIP